MSSDAPKPPPGEPSKTAPEEIPDPDEDDLDELDDVLDEFAATKLDSKPAPTSSGPGRPSNTAAIPPSTGVPLSTGSTTAPGLLPDDDEFARQLQAGMADLLGELESSPEMQKQFEQLVKELGEASEMAEQSSSSASAPAGKSKDAPSSSTGPSSDAQKPTEDSFQEQIRKTMERMQASGDSASAAAQSASEDDFLAQMLKEMEKGGAAGLGSDEDFSKMLMGMMEQLTNKEILYEPMKELDNKFPAWLEENREKTDGKDLERYEVQRTLVREIVGKFEEVGYSDEKVECREFIVERMQKMQAAGSPPPDLVGDMNAAQEAMGELDQGCPTQ